MKKILKNMIVIAAKLIGPLFYEKKYLTGKWFDLKDPDIGWQGWFWVLQGIWTQKILGFNRHIKAPIFHTVRLNSLENLIMNSDQLDNLQSPGCYFQNPDEKIYIGLDTIIGPNVCIITRNHSKEDYLNYDSSMPVKIGAHCWIGANSVILPGVEIGDNTIIGAGSVVTKSFPSNLLVGGNPAKVLKENK